MPKIYDQEEMESILIRIYGQKDNIKYSDTIKNKLIEYLDFLYNYERNEKYKEQILNWRKSLNSYLNKSQVELKLDFIAPKKNENQLLSLEFIEQEENDLSSQENCCSDNMKYGIIGVLFIVFITIGIYYFNKVENKEEESIDLNQEVC